jgi:hypothetical protein
LVVVVAAAAAVVVAKGTTLLLLLKVPVGKARERLEAGEGWMRERESEMRDGRRGAACGRSWQARP